MDGWWTEDLGDLINTQSWMPVLSAQCLGSVEARGLRNRHVLNSLPNKHFHRLLEMVPPPAPRISTKWLERSGSAPEPLLCLPSQLWVLISVAEVRSHGGGRIVWLRSCSWNGAICWGIVSLGFRSLLCQLMLWFYVNKDNLPKPQLLIPGQAEPVFCKQFSFPVPFSLSSNCPSSSLPSLFFSSLFSSF